MESKFIALESVGKEAEWLRNFLSRIPLGMQPTLSVTPGGARDWTGTLYLLLSDIGMSKSYNCINISYTKK